MAEKPPEFQTPKPVWRLSSPRHNGGSTLYDSYELQAVTLQLNIAISQGSKIGSSPTFMSHLKSPFYQQGLGRIYRGSAKTTKRITCSQGARGVTRGLVARIWKKIKQGLLRNKC